MEYLLLLSTISNNRQPSEGYCEELHFGTVYQKRLPIYIKERKDK